jgi:hypothetical protein
MAGWTSTVFAHESPTRLAGFDAENRLYLFALRVPSLSFLSPVLVKAAIEGRLSRGFGVKRLMDLPMGWSDQWSALGLKAPAQT